MLVVVELLEGAMLETVVCEEAVDVDWRVDNSIEGEADGLEDDERTELLDVLAGSSEDVASVI